MDSKDWFNFLHSIMFDLALQSRTSPSIGQTGCCLARWYATQLLDNPHVMSTFIQFGKQSYLILEDLITAKPASSFDLQLMIPAYCNQIKQLEDNKHKFEQASIDLIKHAIDYENSIDQLCGLFLRESEDQPDTTVLRAFFFRFIGHLINKNFSRRRDVCYFLHFFLFF